MAQCIPQIRLSNGKIVNLPVFRYHQHMAGESKMGGILKAYKEESGVRTEIQSSALLTDDELCEFLSLINNRTYTLQAGSNPINTFKSHKVFFAYWIELANGTYRFQWTNALNDPNNKFSISRCCSIYEEDFNRTQTQTENCNFYLSYNNTGIIPYDNDLSSDTVTATTFSQMTAYVEAGESPSRYQYAINCSVTSSHVQIDAYYGTYTTDTALRNAPVGDYTGGYSFIGYDQMYTNITTYAAAHQLSIGINVYNDQDPYSFEPATFGGGNGSMGSFDPDGVDPADIPALPQLSASDCGFMTVYNPTSSQLKSLSAFLWSNAFDIDSFKKLFSDPMQCIIGLAVVPVRPSLAGSKNVTFGDVDSGVSMSYISSEYVEKDMGSVTIDLLYGSFMDYQTNIQIYLPYIGFRQLQPDDIIGGSIQVVYHINVIDGGCTAYIKHSTRGVLYQYSGSCIANIPLSSINYSGAIQNAITAAINGGAVVAGIATGQAPVTIMGAAGLANNAANLACNSKPTVQRSGTVSGSSGLMGIQKPYIIVERPNISVPTNRHTYVGNTTNMTMTLNQCTGFTVVDNIHLDNVICTEGERDELLKLLKEGVIL